MNLQTIIKAYLLKHEAATGYDISLYLKDKTGHKTQQIYRELSSLVKQGVLKFEAIKQSDKPDKKIYSFAKPQDELNVLATKESDFRKTSAAYSLLVKDIMFGSDEFNEYVKTMSYVEEKFIESVE